MSVLILFFSLSLSYSSRQRTTIAHFPVNVQLYLLMHILYSHFTYCYTSLLVLRVVHFKELVHFTVSYRLITLWIVYLYMHLRCVFSI